MIDTNCDYAFGGFMGQITPKKTVDPRFLFYVLTSDAYKNFIGALSDGVNINNLKFDDLKEFSFAVPPLLEQKHIVAILDEVFTSIATTKENTERNLRNTREILKSYLVNVFSNRKREWEEKTLNQISENLDSKRVPITKNVRRGGDYPYYGASGIVDYVDNFIFDGDLLLISEDGANLLARVYPIAFSVSGKTWVNNHAHVLRFKEKATQRFVEYYFNSIKLDNFVSGMAQPKLNQKMLNSIPIPLPSLNDQKQIIEKLDALSQEVVSLEAVYRKKHAGLEELKKAVLQRAFSGELKGPAL